MNLQESIRRILREETEPGKYTKAVKVIVNDFKNEDFVCDIDVYYYADKYEVAVKIDRKEFEKKYENRDISYANILMTGYLDRLKRTIRQEIKNFLPVDVFVWFKQINCDKGLNESEDDKEKKIQKNLKAIRTLLDTIDVDGLCEMWVEYNPEDGDYEIRSKTTRKYLDMADMVRELGYIDDTIRSWGMKTYVYTPYYVENCEDEIEFMNESDESRQERKFTKLLNNIEEYLNSNSYNSVVRFMVDYDEVMDDVIVNIFIDAEDAVKLGGGINSVIKRTGKKIMEDLSVFPFDFKYHIHFDKPQLNESKTSQHLKIINNLLDPLKEKDCLCDIKISFDVEENYYDIYLVFSQKELHEKFSDLYGIRSYIQKMMNEVKMELESFLPIRNIFIGNYTTPNCEWSPLNESEDDEEKKIQKNLTVLRKLISMFEYSEVCDMWVEDDPEDGYYAIRSKMATKNHNTKALEKEFGFLEDSIKYLGLKGYVSHPYWVDECEDEVKFMNESEEKKPKLLSTIEEDGLLQMMQDTGLSLKQIKSKIGELPREVYERYIKDFIKQEGYHQTNGNVQLGYAVEIQKNIQIEHFYMEGDKVTVEIRGYNDYSEQTDGYIESLSNLSDEELYGITKDMIDLGETYSEM